MVEKKVSELVKYFQEMAGKGGKEEALFEKIKEGYSRLAGTEKPAFFHGIIKQIEVSPVELKPYLEELNQGDQGGKEWSSLISELRQRAHSPRLEIFRKISGLHGGLKFLLDLRADLLSAQPQSPVDLNPLNLDLTFLFEIWFQNGLLYLEEITLDTSYRQIEFLKNSDFVHPMTSIEEMGQRLGKDRRCFALYHRLLPSEPVVFIEVALTEGIARNIRDIIEEPADSQHYQKKKTDTAIFYSINNTQQGLAGLGLGQILIGQVVDYVGRENEQIRQFATLSPLPGFWGRYLKPLLQGEDRPFILKPSDISAFFSKREINRLLEKSSLPPVSSGDINQVLLEILTSEDWVVDQELRNALRTPLIRIAYHYLSEEKDQRQKPLNPVAGFHLGNGATVSQKDVNFLANPSPRGLQESCGLMVNYIYRPSWLRQIRQRFLWFDRLEMRGIFSPAS